MSRVIKIIGSIDDESFRTFCEELDKLEKLSHKDITIELASGGGETYFGLAFYGRMRSSPCKIKIKVYGFAMSAATIILAGAHKRLMHKDAWFMIHDDNQKVRADTTVVAISEAKQTEDLETHWATIMTRHTHLDCTQWRELSRLTTYFTAEACLEKGIIDEIFG